VITISGSGPAPVFYATVEQSAGQRDFSSISVNFSKRSSLLTLYSTTADCQSFCQTGSDLHYLYTVDHSHCKSFD